MNARAERWTEVTELFEAAVNLPMPKRTAFLERKCAGDAELRREVQSLLDADAQAGQFMDIPAATVPPVDELHEHLERGSALGRYVVGERLGSGGMGLVYAAYDPELDRKVALKLMRPMASDSASASEGRARLLREAQAMAQLSHPNAIAVYDVGTFREKVFIAMEHIDGSTLTEWLSEEKRSWREVLSMFVQAGRGLAAAHAAGILHRDFKPDNALVDNDGRVRVLDFGLARAAGAGDGISAEVVEKKRPPRSGILGVAVTESGKFMGTPAYMAPEQLMGQTADEKTDQYSFCVALYQGIYGELPFSGEDVPALLREMTQGTPRRLTKSGHVPRWLHRIIVQGLSSTPAHRHPSMNALLDRLQRGGRVVRRHWAIVGALMAMMLLVGGVLAWKERIARLGRIESIAVLPLENVTGDPSQDYFVDGMTEALITDLAQISALRVTSRSSVMRYRAVKKPLPEIAKELRVDAIVEGSVTRSKNRVRITAQLIDGRSDRHLWAKGYEGELNDILALQRGVARAVAAEIAIKLKPEEQARLAAARSVDPEVYWDYLQGRFYSYKRTRQSIEKGIEYFQRALQKDPNYAPAYAGLGDCYAYLSMPIHALSPSESARLTKAAVIKALSLDDSLAEAHATLALVTFRYDWDWAGAEKEFKRAIELNPSNAWARMWYGNYLMSMKRKDEALAEFNRAVLVDPLSSTAYTNVGQWFVHDGQYDRAIEQYLKSLELDPTIYATHFFLAEAYERKGMYEEAIAAMKRSEELSGVGDNIPMHALARIYGSSGRRVEAQSILEQAERHPMANRVAFWIAGDYASLGRKDDALRWLERAYEAREFNLPSLSVYWRFDPLRSDPRFEDLLRRMGLPQ